MDYPVYNAVPTFQLMTACEALCWIGYKRAITKKIYFSPMIGAESFSEESPNWDAILHDAIPAPKPLLSPIDEATDSLMQAARVGTVRALYINAATKLRLEVPKSDFDADVAVSVRGGLEPKGLLDMPRYMAARAQISRGDLWFLTHEIVANWPPATDAKTCSNKPISAEKNMEKWLAARMGSDRDNPISKKAIRAEAKDSGIVDPSGRGFDRAYINAVKSSGAIAWSAPGRRR
jgi:hypothetical protein